MNVLTIQRFRQQLNCEKFEMHVSTFFLLLLSRYSWMFCAISLSRLLFLQFDFYSTSANSVEFIKAQINNITIHLQYNCYRFELCRFRRNQKRAFGFFFKYINTISNLHSEFIVTRHSSNYIFFYKFYMVGMKFIQWSKPQLINICFLNNCKIVD